MIIVTGGAGMIGSNIVAALNAEGHDDILVVDDLTDGHKIANLADLKIADYLDKDDFLHCMEAGSLGRIEAVFHQGACSTTTEWNGKFMMEVNYAFSKRLLHASQALRVPFLYASSASVYGGGSEFREDPALERPLNVYAYSKKLFDDYVRRTVFDPNHSQKNGHSQVAGLRYFNVYGPREAHKGAMASVAFHLFNQVEQGQNPKLFGAYDGFGPGEQSRDFIHVGDVADVNLWLWKRQLSGIFNCGTGRAQPFRAIAETVIDTLGKGEIEFIEFPDHLKGSYQSFTQADMSRLRVAGYNGQFRTVETGVRDYVEWLKAQRSSVIGPRWVGDMVMAQCLFSALKELHPNAAIDVLAPAWAAPLVKRMPEIRQQIDFPLKPGALEFTHRRRFGRLLRGRYDSAYILPGSWKSALIPFFARIPRRVGHLREMRYGLLTDIVPLPDSIKRRTAQAYFGLAQGGGFRAPRLSVDANNQAALLDRFGLAPRKFVALMPGAEFGPAKRWPSESYAGLARDFMGKGLKVALFGSKNDRDVTAEIASLAPGVVDLAGQTRLEDAIDLISASRLAVSNDSGLMHVAAAVGTPIVAVYGSTSPENTPPLAKQRELVWLGLSCSPCHQKVCPLGHLNCLKTLEVGQVAAAADRLLEIPAAA